MAEKPPPRPAEAEGLADENATKGGASAPETGKHDAADGDRIEISAPRCNFGICEPDNRDMNDMGLPVIDERTSEEEIDQIVSKATTASNFLKAISHEGRLMILCHLVTGEKSVTELENLLSARQAAVSQQLSRLRLEGLVQPRRDGKTIYYSLTDDRPRKILEVVYELFCKDDNAC
jgi:DNA-binding transcriptional ArsR family regulator